MYFSKEDLEKLHEGYPAVIGKCQRLRESYLNRKYNDAQAQEYARHGFLRRLGTLVRCIDNVFEILPPDRVDLPTSEELSDAVINIQAFVFNVFGCADNLAWIWVSEKNLTKANGSPIPPIWVGLRKKNELIRDSFSPTFSRYLKRLDGWFDNLEDFRHALAHRIPLYLPPYLVPEDKKEAYQELENRMAKAVMREDMAEYDRLLEEQRALVAINLCMTHSFEEEAPFVVFHPQLLADFNTIEELGQKMLDELDRK